ncbi:hypothetical protein ACFXP3_01265 [Streptomyces sp. NPDC059096]|uniref:hypothetical protein n=1 Tax=Streptomyces sp. NPDC059096 TaxID=3346727 RepID=UPI0036743D69
MIAQGLHAQLYGLPTVTDPLPTALDALLQTTRAALSGQQRGAVLRRVADQLRDGAEIIKDSQYRAQWDRLPDDIAVQLRQAHDLAQQLADILGHVAPAFTNPGAAAAGSPSPASARGQDGTVAAPASASAPPPGRRR